MKNIADKRKIKYKHIRKFSVAATIFVAVIFILSFSSAGYADSMEEAILDALDKGFQAAGYNVLPPDHTDTEGFDPNTPEGLQIYNAMGFGYGEEDEYRAVREIYSVTGKKGDVNFVVSVCRFDTEEYAHRRVCQGGFAK